MFDDKFRKRMWRIRATFLFIFGSIFGFFLGGWLEKNYEAYDILVTWFIKYEYLFEWSLILLAIISGAMLVIAFVYIEAKKYMLKRKKVSKNRKKGEEDGRT